MKNKNPRSQQRSGRNKIRGTVGEDLLYGDPLMIAQDFNAKGYILKHTSTRHGNDKIQGLAGNDFISDQLGRDRLRGGEGNDLIISRSDSNIPAENKRIQANVNDGNDVEKLVFARRFYNPNNLAANDHLTGGDGADTFQFELLINAPKAIYSQHVRADGSINWGMNGVAGENNNYHDHWVESIGRDTITDFSGSGGEGDQVVIKGHTVTYDVIKEFDNRVVLGVYSDQGADGIRGGGAHDLDVLGVINIKHDGNFNLRRDVTVINEDLGAFETISQSPRPDTNQWQTLFQGGLGRDKLIGNPAANEIYGDPMLTAQDFKASGYLNKRAQRRHGNDKLKGKEGNDILTDQLGRDRYFGGEGNDVLVSISDANVPAENKRIKANVDDGNDVNKLSFAKRFYNPDNLAANDRLTGGAGADTFKFDLLINAPAKIYTQHIQDDGLINWGMNGVAGENNNYHDHWVEGIGRDVITDFSGTGGEGDQIIITGHTVTYTVLNADDNKITLGLYSDQGADGVRGGGAHDLDVLGVIRINHDGHFNLNKDVTVVNEDLGAF